ncbi:hypothetical protein ABFV05_010580 [Capra hircus]
MSLWVECKPHHSQVSDLEQRPSASWVRAEPGRGPVFFLRVLLSSGAESLQSPGVSAFNLWSHGPLLPRRLASRASRQAPEHRPARRQVTCVSDSLSQGGPRARAPLIGGAGPGPAPGRGARAGGPDGRAQRRISCSEAAQQQKERDAPAVASGAASGGLERPSAPRPAVREPQLPQPPARGSPPAAFAARPAAGRAHVSAGGAGVQSHSLRIAPRAAVGAAPPRSPLAPAGRQPTTSAAPGVRAGAGRPVGCLVSASPHPERGLFSRGRRGTDLLFSLLLTPPPALRRWTGAARPGLGVGGPGPRRGERGGPRRPGAQPPGLSAARPALPARGGSATPRPALARPSLAGPAPRRASVLGPKPRDNDSSSFSPKLNKHRVHFNPRLNKMFVGEVNTSSNQEPEFSEKEDDEWILVDFIDTCTGFSAAEDEEEEDISEESPPERPSVFSCLPASLECLADASDSCFLQFESCPMEESWFITPPPCFTAGGLTTIKVETSPMENLLIEHPSMSVYAVHEPCPSLSEAHCGAEEFHNPGSPRVDAENEMGQHIHCYVAALAAHTAFLEQPKSFRPSQWIKEHSERQSLNRNSLRRQNLTRDCHSRQVKHSGWAVHQPCPRQYNY